RIVTIPYYPLSDEMVGRIIRLQLDRVVKRVRAGQGIELSYSEDVVKLISSRCTEPESGGRMIDAILTNTLLPRISHGLLERMAIGQGTASISVHVTDGDLAYTFG
ncbi:MAG: type VI secretion system ATPase TssH, partial [Pseudomonadota bacterium]